MWVVHESNDYRDPGLFGVHSLVGQRVQTTLHNEGGGYFYCHHHDEIILISTSYALQKMKGFLFVCLESQSIIAMVVIFFFIKFL